MYVTRVPHCIIYGDTFGALLLYCRHRHYHYDIIMICRKSQKRKKRLRVKHIVACIRYNIYIYK